LLTVKQTEKKPWLRQPGRLFFLLWLIYIAIGIVNLELNSLTSDESAYIGAAYAYSQGVGVNPEHPLLLKLVNSLIFRWQFPQIAVELPTLNYLDDRQLRLAAFEVGYQVLMYFPEQFEAVIASSRFIYLLINSSLLMWLGIYSDFLKLIPVQLSSIFALLWIFAPSFSSHSGLVAFDVAVAVSALMVVMTLAIAIYSAVRLQGKYLGRQMVILTLCLIFAVNTKFSNLLLLPIVVGALTITIIFLTQQNRKSLAIKLTQFSIISLALQPLITAGMYHIAFRQSLNGAWFGWLVPLRQGLRLTRISAQGENVPFLWGQFRPVTNGHYLAQVFFFKENFVIYGIIAMILFAGYQFNQKRKIQFISLLKPKGRLGIFLSGIIISYPLLYLILATQSRFVLGYRYIYPVTIFAYFLIAVLLFVLQQYYPQKLLGAMLILYCFVGILAIPQTLSYTNLFWTKPKWFLSNDSTINWGQENRQVVDFLLTHRQLPETNEHSLIYQTFGVNININQYLEVLANSRNYPLDIQSYYQQSRFDPLKEAIATLPHTYLIIDSIVFQTLYAERHQSAIASQNWDYLEKHQPIYEHNDIMFVYQLH
jgi:hypothetical protein